MLKVDEFEEFRVRAYSVNRKHFSPSNESSGESFSLPTSPRGKATGKPPQKCAGTAPKPSGMSQFEAELSAKLKRLFEKVEPEAARDARKAATTPARPTSLSSGGHTRSLSCRARRAAQFASLAAAGHPKRSLSCRVRSRRAPRQVDDDAEPPRPRTFSMPSSDVSRRLADADDIFYRVRTFSTSSKRITNCGDSFKRRARAAKASDQDSDTFGSLERLRGLSLDDTPTDSTTSVCSGASAYTVYVVGSPGVGKSSLITQFMTSDYLANTDPLQDIDDFSVCSVSILLDDAESVVRFQTVVDVEEIAQRDEPDAYVVVYSVTDKNSFIAAVDSLHELQKEETTRHTALILVANKSDIVRSREVTDEDGKVMADRYSCKYIEVSAVLNHRVDELLAGTLQQIRLHCRRRGRGRAQHGGCLPNNDGCLQDAARGVVARLFRNNSFTRRSCDNLLVP